MQVKPLLAAAVLCLTAGAAQAAEPVETVSACGFRPLQFDLLRPSRKAAVAASVPVPAVIIVHGGSWLGGSRRDEAGLMRFFAAQGYLAMSIDYRLSAQASFPAQIEDMKCAICWLQKHAAQYQADPDRIAAYGISAGAHLVALAAVSAGKWDDAGGEGGVQSRLRCAVLQAPPLDLPGWWQSADATQSGPMAPRYMLTRLFGQTYQQAPERYAEASPASYAGKAAAGSLPAMLVIQGDQDATIPPLQARQFVRALQASGNRAELLAIPDGDHFGFGSQGAQVAAKLKEFLASCLK